MPLKGHKRSAEHTAKIVKKLKGQKRSLESRSKMSESAKKRKPNFLGKKHSQETKNRISKAKTGYKYTDEQLIKVRRSAVRRRGENAYNWNKEGGKAAVHPWIERLKGKPNYCEICKKSDKKKYEWANKNHKYKRIIDDYMRLCTSCHRKYDIKHNNYLIQI